VLKSIQARIKPNRSIRSRSRNLQASIKDPVSGVVKKPNANTITASVIRYGGHQAVFPSVRRQVGLIFLAAIFPNARRSSRDVLDNATRKLAACRQGTERRRLLLAISCLGRGMGSWSPPTSTARLTDTRLIERHHLTQSTPICHQPHVCHHRAADDVHRKGLPPNREEAINHRTRRGERQVTSDSL